MRRIAGTDLEVFPLGLGGNVFGWTADRDAAFAVLDAFREAGGNLIDTADVYCSWIDGVGGQSESIIGEWHTARGNRDELVIATKVGQKPDRLGLSAENVRAAADESLARLRTDHIDIYFAHIDDKEVPVEETLGAMAELVQAGKVRYIGASNFTPARLQEALSASDANGLPRYAVVEPEYNLVHREYEAELGPFCQREGLGCIPYFGLAGGFLTGKYRTPEDASASPRGEHALSHLDERGKATLAALDEVAASRGVSVAAVALAWLASRPTVAAPLASARSVDQLDEILQAASLTLDEQETEMLDAASAA